MDRGRRFRLPLQLFRLLQALALTGMPRLKRLAGLWPLSSDCRKYRMMLSDFANTRVNAAQICGNNGADVLFLHISQHTRQAVAAGVLVGQVLRQPCPSLYQSVFHLDSVQLLQHGLGAEPQENPERIRSGPSAKRRPKKS